MNFQHEFLAWLGLWKKLVETCWNVKIACFSIWFIYIYIYIYNLYIHNLHTYKFLILILRKNTQNERIIAHFEYFFTCHYTKTVWLAENLNEIKITHYEKIFSHIKQKDSHFEKGFGIKNIFLSHWDYHYFHWDISH